MTITTDIAADPDQPLELAKNFLVRAALDGTDQWEVSWGEGSTRMYYEFPRDVAVFFMTAGPTASRAEWCRRAAAELELDSDDAESLVDTLITDGLLAGPGGDLTPGEAQWLDVEWSDALQLHWAERNCRWAHDYTNNPKVMTRYDGQNVQPDTAPPGPFPCVPAAGKQAVVLPDAVALDGPFKEIQRARRTAYQFQDTTIDLRDVSTILQWTLKAKWSDGVSPLRVSQSYSRGEPFVGFVAFGSRPPEGCAANTIYQYDPASNVLAPRSDPVPDLWSDLLWEQQFADGAPMALILAANWEHFMWKYRFPRAYRWVYTECGSFLQTALTVATGLGIRAWQTPALDDAYVGRLLGYDEARLSPVYLAAFGRPAGR